MERRKRNEGFNCLGCLVTFDSRTRAEMKLRIRETKLQKEERVEGAFERLTMGSRSHALFRTLFEARLDDYTEAKEAMFFYTDTADAPWVIVKSNDKKRARLNCMQHFLASVDYPDKDEEIVGRPDPLIVGRAQHVVQNSEHVLSNSLHPDKRLT